MVVEEVEARREGEDVQSISRDLELSHRTRRVLVDRSFIDKPNGSKSTEQELSMVNQRTERRL